MSEILQQKWRVLFKQRYGYPRFRQVLLWTRDLGLVLMAALCMGLALFASPTVLSDHPWLQTYVNFMGGYFGAVHRLSVGALYPQVSELVFAVGWGVAMVPFVASLLHAAIYSLVLDYQNTKADMARSYEENIIGNGYLVDLIALPIVVLMLVLIALGDLGVIYPSLGLVNGVGMARTNAYIDHGHLDLVGMALRPLYVSRWGLGVVSTLLITVGVILYSTAWLIPIFKGPIWLRRRLTRRHAR